MPPYILVANWCWLYVDYYCHWSMNVLNIEKITFPAQAIL